MVLGGVTSGSVLDEIVREAARQGLPDSSGLTHADIGI
jgi:hypothetical protein